MVLALWNQFLGENNQEDLLCFSDATTRNTLLRSLEGIFFSLSFPFLNKYSSSHNRNCRTGYNEISFPFLPACFGWLGEAKVLEYDYPYLREKNDIICHLTSSRHSVWCALSQCRENSKLTANRYPCPQLFRHFCLL